VVRGGVQEEFRRAARTFELFSTYQMQARVGRSVGRGWLTRATLFDIRIASIMTAESARRRCRALFEHGLNDRDMTFAQPWLYVDRTLAVPALYLCCTLAAPLVTQFQREKTA
jgi:hypothetical protein